MKELWHKTPFKLGLSFALLMLLVIGLALPALTIRTFGTPVVFEAEGFASNRNLDGSLIRYQLSVESVPLERIDSRIIEIYEAQQAAYQGFGVLFNLEDTPLYLHLTLDASGRVTDTYLTTTRSDDGLYLTPASHILNYDFRDQAQTPPLLGIDLNFQLPPFNSTRQFVQDQALGFDPTPLRVHARIWRGRIQVTDITAP